MKLRVHFFHGINDLLPSEERVPLLMIDSDVNTIVKDQITTSDTCAIVCKIENNENMSSLVRYPRQESVIEARRGQI